MTDVGLARSKVSWINEPVKWRSRWPAFVPGQVLNRESSISDFCPNAPIHSLCSNDNKNSHVHNTLGFMMQFCNHYLFDLHTEPVYHFIISQMGKLSSERWSHWVRLLSKWVRGPEMKLWPLTQSMSFLYSMLLLLLLEHPWSIRKQANRNLSIINFKFMADNCLHFLLHGNSAVPQGHVSSLFSSSLVIRSCLCSHIPLGPALSILPCPVDANLPQLFYHM